MSRRLLHLRLHHSSRSSLTQDPYRALLRALSRMTFATIRKTQETELMLNSKYSKRHRTRIAMPPSTRQSSKALLKSAAQMPHHMQTSLHYPKTSDSIHVDVRCREIRNLQHFRDNANERSTSLKASSVSNLTLSNLTVERS